MTTKRAVELIKIDIEYYRKQIGIMDKFKDNFIKKNTLTDSPPDSTRYWLGDIAQSFYDMFMSLYKSQIKYYEDILAELEPKKKSRKL